jgi:hypothetical protein
MDGSETGLLSNEIDGRHYNLDVSIKISLESPPMKRDRSAGILLRVLSYLPDGIPPGSLENLGLFSVKEAYQASSTLRNVSLAYQDSIEGLRSLSPIRHYISCKTPLEGGVLKTVQQYYLGLVKMAEQVLNAQVLESIRVLGPELGNLFSVLWDLAGAPNIDNGTSDAIFQSAWFSY